MIGRHAVPSPRPSAPRNYASPPGDCIRDLRPVQAVRKASHVVLQHQCPGGGEPLPQTLTTSLLPLPNNPARRPTPLRSSKAAPTLRIIPARRSETRWKLPATLQGCSPGASVLALPRCSPRRPVASRWRRRTRRLLPRAMRPPTASTTCCATCCRRRSAARRCATLAPPTPRRRRAWSTA